MNSMHYKIVGVAYGRRASVKKKTTLTLALIALLALIGCNNSVDQKAADEAMKARAAAAAQAELDADRKKLADIASTPVQLPTTPATTPELPTTQVYSAPAPTPVVTTVQPAAPVTTAPTRAAAPAEPTEHELAIARLERDKESVRAMENERKQRDIGYEIERLEGEISGLENEIGKYQANLAAELEQLKRKKLHASNNLAGATWETSISDEMRAVAERYEILVQNDRGRVKANRDMISQLRQDLTELKRSH